MATIYGAARDDGRSGNQGEAVGPFRRLAATGLDLALLFAAAYGVSWLLWFQRPMLAVWLDQRLLLVAAGVYLARGVIWLGDSPGNVFLGHRIVREDYHAVGAFRHLARFFVALVTCPLAPINLVLGFTDRRKRALHDIVAATWVLQTPGMAHWRLAAAWLATLAVLGWAGFSASLWAKDRAAFVPAAATFAEAPASELVLPPDPTDFRTRSSLPRSEMYAERPLFGR